MYQVRRAFSAGYVSVLLSSLVLSIFAGWTTLAERMDGDAYDWMFRVHPRSGAPPRSIVVAFDERTLSSTGGVRNLRPTLTRTLQVIAAAQPRVVALDITVPDADSDAADLELAAAFARVPHLILPSNVEPQSGTWEEPAVPFRRYAAAIAHVHAAPDPVSRVLPLEVVSGGKRRWAVALEAARLYLGEEAITESPNDVQLGSLDIPAARSAGRPLYIQYREAIPEISAAVLLSNPEASKRLRDKAVFVGVTPQTAARDRLMTPLGYMMSGVEIHAQAFETIVNGRFLRVLSNLELVLICLLFTLAAGLTFGLLVGWPAYLMAAVILIAAHSAPHLAFSRGIVLPYLPVVFSAWLAVISAAAWQYFVVRRQLRKSESEKARYQQAIHFVTHEMRSPLTAIQGSSELMGRYNLNDEKRKEMADMINSESKRLAKMIQTFLDIERLTDGQMEIRSEVFEVSSVLRQCIERARPLAERKDIEVEVAAIDDASLKGDRELMEYAVYNLLTNAVKYSPAETRVTVSAVREGASIRVAVRDQGIGMDQKELKSIFKKFYRTRKAEASGEAGTGIGLSLVEQIVSHHGGRVEVSSAPGQGSCFTIVLPVPALTLAEQ